MKKSLAAVAAVAASTALLVPFVGPSATATSPRTGDSTFAVLKTGTVSVLGNTGHILGGKVVNGTGTVGVEILGNNLNGALTSAVATSTTFNSNIKLVFAGNTLNMVAAFTGSNWTYSGTTTGDLALQFTGLKVAPYYPPAGKKIQYPVNCPVMPTALKKNTSTVIFHHTCRTNAGNVVKLRLATSARSTRGDVPRGPIATLIYGNNGAVVLRTYNRNGRIVLTESAPGNAKYKVFAHSHAYTLASGGSGV